MSCFLSSSSCSHRKRSLSASFTIRSFSDACCASIASYSLRCSFSLPVSRSTFASSRFSASHRLVASSRCPISPSPSPRRVEGRAIAERSASRMRFSSSPMRLASDSAPSLSCFTASCASRRCRSALRRSVVCLRSVVSSDSLSSSSILQRSRSSPSCFCTSFCLVSNFLSVPCSSSTCAIEVSVAVAVLGF